MATEADLRLAGMEADGERLCGLLELLRKHGQVTVMYDVVLKKYIVANRKSFMGDSHDARDAIDQALAADAIKQHIEELDSAPPGTTHR